MCSEAICFVLSEWPVKAACGAGLMAAVPIAVGGFDGCMLCMVGLACLVRKGAGCVIDLERDKGIRWMPWHQEAMKDVARCEKPRGAASRR